MAALSEFRSFSAIAASFILDVSRSPSSRIFSKRSSLNSPRVASSPWLRSSKAVFWAWTLWNCTCKSSCFTFKMVISLVACSARAACACATSSCAELFSRESSASSLARRRPEHSSLSWQASAAKASYSSELLVVARSTSSRTFSLLISCSSLLNCSSSASEALPAPASLEQHSSCPCSLAFSLRMSSISWRSWSSWCCASVCFPISSMEGRLSNWP
mmetsp:Transcript_115553/g.299563  ORF Transcript_115553/g.299563 Transcript_115553/m.299563 type:complete len:217 (-) Transcript_115553:3085-3735(-)